MSKKAISSIGSVFIFVFIASIASAALTETVSTESTASANIPDMAVDSNYIYVVWYEQGTDGFTHIYYKRKTLSGSWTSSSRELVSTEQTSGNAYNPKIKVDSGYIYVVWEDESNYGSYVNSDRKIAYKRKTIDGAWSSATATEVVSTETNGKAYHPQLALDSSYVYVVWEDTGSYSGSGGDRDIFFKRKPLAGTWPNTTELVSSESSVESYKPVLAVDSNNVYVAWYDYDSTTGRANIYYKSKPLNDTTWPVHTDTVSTETIVTSWADNPGLALAIDSSYVHICWHDNTDYGNGAKFNIVYKKKQIAGSWPIATELVSSETTGIATNPTIGVDANNVYAVWVDSSNINNIGTNWHIFFKKKTISGSWGTVTQVISDESTGNVYSPAISVRSNTTPSTIHMVWADETDFGYGNISRTNIVYRKFQGYPPVVTVTYPNGGESPTGTITVTATATDSDSNITSVAFYYTADNGKTSYLIGTDTGTPYGCSWDTTKVSSSGYYKIKAVVTSDDGGQGTDYSDDDFYINKYYDDTTFNTYTFGNSPTATCYKGKSTVLPLASEANEGTQVTDTSQLQLKDGLWESITTNDIEYVFMKFNFKITQSLSDIKMVYIECTANSNGILPGYYPGISLYLWNNTLGKYDQKAAYITEIGTNTLATTINSSISDYLKADGTIQILIETINNGFSFPSRTLTISADYIKIDISTDVTAPAAISNLQATSGPKRGEVTLTWTAPGDDGNLRKASKYIIKYATATFTDTDWDASFVTTVSSLTAPTPKETGNTETLALSLTADTTYYFALKTQDEVPNTSAISNIVQAMARTNTAPVATINTPSGIQSKDITIVYTLSDADADSCSVSVSYSKDGGTTFAAATKAQGGDTLTGLTASSTTATNHTFSWDSMTDLGKNIYDQVQIRITPTDNAGKAGTAVATSNFSVDNTATQDTVSNDYNYPNPFKPKQGNLTIRYILNKDTDVKIRIYNLVGELIKEQEITAGTAGAIKGTNKITWDGKNQEQEFVSSGIYLICIEADGYKQIQKVAVIK